MKASVKPELMKALLVFGFFVLMASLNVIAERDKVNSTKRDLEEWRENLFLDASQEKRIAILDQEFYEDLSDAYTANYSDEDEFCGKVKQIIASHNKKIEEALNTEQRKKFQTFISCYDLP
jgi:hypothetical protein